MTASGTMAQAMEAEVAQSSGLASVRCGEPGSDIWFVGPGQQNGAAQIQLDLMNVDSLAASVDVSVITDAGPVQAGDDTGIIGPAAPDRDRIPVLGGRRTPAWSRSRCTPASAGWPPTSPRGPSHGAPPAGCRARPRRPLSW